MVSAELCGYSPPSLAYLRALREGLAHLHLDPPVFVGGRLNRIPDDSAWSLPVDVSESLQALGAEDMLTALVEMALEREA